MAVNRTICINSNGGGGGHLHSCLNRFLNFPILIYKCEVEEEKGEGRKQSRWKETEKSKSFHTFITAKGEQVDTNIERIRGGSGAA